MISLKDMKFLTALAQRKHFARAAEDCGVSQPAFSMRIRKIEEEVGVSIVRRGSRFEGFTVEGQIILRHAHKIMDDLKSMEQDVKSAQGEISGTVSVGVIPTAVVYSAHAVKRLHEQHPGIRVNLHTATSLAIQQGVENGQFDVGITYGDGLAGGLLRVDPLFEERYLLLASAGLLGQKRDRITWAEAAELPLCLLEPKMQNRRILDHVFSELGLAPEVIMESSGFLASIVLATESAAATIIPESLLDLFQNVDGLVGIELVEPEVEKPICLVSRARELGLPIVDALRAVCVQNA